MAKFVANKNLPGNPDSKIVSKCGNPDNFCKIFLEIMKIVTKPWNLLKLYQKYLEMWSKTFSGIQILETTGKCEILTSSWGRALFIWKSPIQALYCNLALAVQDL